MNFLPNTNYHTHTIFCDGKDTPEELVREAISLGCPAIGFSGHSYYTFDDCCMTPEGTEAYIREIRRLKKVYRDKIQIFLGIEQDIFSVIKNDSYDYVIGSVHYVPHGKEYHSVDYTREDFIHTVETVYDGDYYAFSEAYYKLMGSVYEVTKCDIIGHFDLITKFNEGDCLFSTRDARYRKAADDALERLMEAPAVLEINTGAMARGYRSSPYPAEEFIQKWKAAGKKLVFSSDCHEKNQLMYGFSDCFRWL